MNQLLFRFMAVCIFVTLPCVAFSHGQIHDLIEKVDRKLEKDSANASLYVDRGQLYLEEQHYEEAVHDFAKAIEVDKKLAEAHYYMGVALLGEKKYKEAAIFAEQAISLATPEDTELRSQAYFLLGDIRVAQKQPDQAIVAYDDAIRITPMPTPDQYIYYVDALLSLGKTKYGAAVTLLQQATDKLGPVITLEYKLLDVYALQGDTSRALAQLDTMIARGHSKEVLFYRKGEIYLGMKEKAKASAAFNQALLSINELPLHRQSTKHIKESKQKILQQLDVLNPKKKTAP